MPHISPEQMAALHPDLFRVSSVTPAFIKWLAEAIASNSTDNASNA